MDRSVRVSFSNIASKQLKKLPKRILLLVEDWIKVLIEDGLIKTRKLPGYHDEPLKGKRSGQRSIRLNRSYRLIYEEAVDGLVIYIVVVEVNKHEY